ncbi:MAG TPA: tetratricopeptide repeat protein [Candidatus Limnocylindrales bacterium]|nr:tetratricopeptide repeat protein [Candidatus Limnocylindrales bacterium]
MNPRIITDPNLFNGKPFIKGAGVPIHTILDLLSTGSSFNDIIAKYPKLTEDDISAAVEYALLKTRDELLKPPEPSEPKPSPSPQPIGRGFPRIPTRLTQPKEPAGGQASESQVPPHRPIKFTDSRLSGPPEPKHPPRRLVEPRPPSNPPPGSGPISASPRGPELKRPSEFDFRVDRSEDEWELSFWDKFTRTLDRIKTFLVLTTKIILAVLILTLFGFFVYYLVNGEPSITVLPFESGMGFETSEAMGESLANQLVGELVRIQDLQKFSKEEEHPLIRTLLEEKPILLPPATEPLRVTFKKAESIRLGSFKIPLYPALLEAKKLLNQEDKFLSGSIQKFGSSYSIVASLGKKKFFNVSETDLEVYPPAPETERPDEKIQKLIRILAYKLASAHVSTILPSSTDEGWRSYFYFSEGLEAYQKFLSNPKTHGKDWELALDNFQKALAFHYANPKTHFNLGLAHEIAVDQEISESKSKTEHLNKAAEAYREAIKLKPDFPEAYYQLSTLYRVQKDYPRAIWNLNKAIEIKTAIRDQNLNSSTGSSEFSDKFLFPLLHLKLGELYLLTGKYGEAKNVYQSLLSLGEKVSEPGKYDPTQKEVETLAHYGLAKVYQASGDFNAAVREYNEVLKSDLQPSLKTLAHRSIGQLYTEQGKYSEAIFEYQQALRLNPEDEKSHLQLSLAYSHLNQYPEAIKELKEAIQINPNYAEAYQALGDVYFRQNKTYEAIEAYKQALQIRPEYPEALYGLGLAYARRQANAEAIEQYQKVLQIDPKFPGVRTNLGLIYYRLGKYPEAISEFIQVLQEHPEDAWSHLGIGLVHAKQGHYSEAEAKYREILQINPNFAPAHNHLGQVYAAQKKFSEAIAEYKKALELDLEYAEAHANLGIAYVEMGKYDEALSELKTALKLNEALPEAQVGLGKVYTKQGLIPKAIAAYQEALRLDDKNVEALYGLATLLLSQDKASEALVKLQQALEINPNFLEARLSLAKIYLQQGDYPKATEEFKKVLKLDPKNTEASQGLEQAEQNLSK